MNGRRFPKIGAHVPSWRDVAGLWRIFADLVRYGFVSAAALALDCGLLFLLVSFGLHYQLAAAMSFIAGMGVAYIGSLVFVFRDRRTHRPAVEAAGFFAIGLLGLFLNQALLFCLVSGGFGLAVAKPVTAVCVFMFNFTTRRGLLFARPKSVAQRWRQVPSSQPVVSMKLPATGSAEPL